MAVFPKENGTPTLCPTHRDRKTALESTGTRGEEQRAFCTLNRPEGVEEALRQGSNQEALDATRRLLMRPGARWFGGRAIAGFCRCKGWRIRASGRWRRRSHRFERRWGGVRRIFQRSRARHGLSMGGINRRRWRRWVGYLRSTLTISPAHDGGLPGIPRIRFPGRWMRRR